MAAVAKPASAKPARRRHLAGQRELRPGSEDHKNAFCRMLLDTHDPYRPAAIDWPPLDPEARARLVALPIWDIAVQTEGKASIRVASYADRVADPVLREAILLNGFEEARHKQVLSKLVEAYSVCLAPEPEYNPPRRPEGDVEDMPEHLRKDLEFVWVGEIGEVFDAALRDGNRRR